METPPLTCGDFTMGPDTKTNGSSSTSMASGYFPPCTADTCTVDEKEKERYAAKPSCDMAERCVQGCAAYGRVCPCAARIAAHAACEAMQELIDNSRVFVPPEGVEPDQEGKPDFPYLNADDIVIGEKLGEGGFSNVNACVVTTGDEAGQEFAVKYLKRKAMVELHQFKHGAADIAIEAFFLHVLNHPNIVKLHGITAGSVESNVAKGKECGFFIVVDRLYSTLEQKLEKWREEEQSCASVGLLLRVSAEHKQKQKEKLMERVRIALAIAEAMEYLHSREIIFRDLKPDNVGFDKDGVLKLFDFGLAKELKPGMEKPDGRYELTGNTGSRRYMSPEVAKECPYNKSVDVYSFGILLWELCAAEKPFYGYSSGKHMQQVVIGGERPRMDAQHTAHWPANLQWLMNQCWSPFPTVRPSFTVIKHVLNDILSGEETVPQSLADISEEKEQEASDHGSVEAPASGFGSIFPLSRKKPRSKTHEVELPKDGFKSIKPSAKTGRARTWGFGLRK